MLKVVVFDNYSTDNSVELLSKYPWIEIRQFHSDGQNDIIQAQIKNQCWLEAKGKADKQYGMCYEYNFPEEKSREEYKQYQAESVDISNL